MVTFAEYLQAVADTWDEVTDWRLGQTFYNVLADERFDLSQLAQHKSCDPFYEDKNIPDFLVCVQANWDQGSIPSCCCHPTKDTGGYVIADLACSVHGVNGTSPGDWRQP
jgi:hypothetical protein